MKAARANQFKNKGLNYGSANVKQPHNEFPSHEGAYGHFKVVLDFKLKGYPKTGFINSRYNFGASALSKLQSQNQIAGENTIAFLTSIL
jgi:hypothetical protein